MSYNNDLQNNNTELRSILAMAESLPEAGANDAVRYGESQNLTEDQKAQARENIGAVSKSGISLGVHSDGLVYIFVDGSPVGDGIDLATVGDLIGYVDENNNIIVQGNLADGTYSVKYEMENGSTVNIGNLVLDSNVYYSVTKNLTKCSISNSATRVVEGESYSATITANSGYELKSVTVTMGGSPVAVSSGNINIASVTGDIVITAVAEEIPAATYTITNNLTNCKNSNSATTVEEGSAYSATITANSGYTLDSVSATMGGAAVTVTDGKINIASVTGNIVITATAKAIPTYTNLADPTSADWLANTRISSSSFPTQSGITTSNWIAVKEGDVVRIKGIDVNTHIYARVAFFNANKAIQSSAKISGQTSEYCADVTYDTTGCQFTCVNGGAVWMRICGELNGTANDVIITINEPIE